MKRVLAIVCTMAVCTGAFAEYTKKDVSWDSLVQSCQTPEGEMDQFGRQLRAGDITVTCKDKRTRWTELEDAEPKVRKNVRTVVSSLVSNKYDVTASPKRRTVGEDTFHCPIIKREWFSVTKDFELTCADVLKYASIDSFCLEKLDEKIAAKPGLLKLVKDAPVATVKLCDAPKRRAPKHRQQ
jgi:hypothetical protein